MGLESERKFMFTVKIMDVGKIAGIKLLLVVHVSPYQISGCDFGTFLVYG